MHRTRLALAGACLTVAAVTAATPAAFAWDGGVSGASASVSPDSVRPGGWFDLHVDCSAFAKPNPTKADGQGLDHAITLHKGKDGHYWGRGQLAWHLDHWKSVGIDGNCKEKGSGSRYQTTVWIDRGPHGGVHTGLGGSIHSNTTETVLGGTLLAAALAGGVVVMRRRATAGAK